MSKEELPEIKESTSIFNHVMELAVKKKVAPVKGYWEYDIGPWKIGVNGTDESAPVEPRNCMKLAIRPFSVAYWCNGVYVGFSNARNTILMTETRGDEKFDVYDLEKLLKDEIERI